MADLISHIAVAHILKRPSPWPAHPLIFAVGASLPDLVGRAPGLLLENIGRMTRWEPAPYLSIGSDALHTPLPYTVLCFFLALWVPMKLRRTVFRNLLFGGLLHMLMDLPQTHITGGYRPLFPFSWHLYELQWFGSEDSLVFAIPLGLSALGVEYWYQRKRAGQLAR